MAESTMKVQLMGVRGSTPAPGRPFVDVGGHTSCLAVLPMSEDARWLVLDAGTGFRNLAVVLGDRPLSADVLLTHLHWDHMQGLPFLPQADRDDADIALWIPTPSADGSDHVDQDSAALDARSLELLAGAFTPPYFPIRPDELRGEWRFHALRPNQYLLSQRVITVAELHHKGGTTLGMRVAERGRSFAYLPDHAIRTASAEQLASADTLADGVDVLFHGAPYLDREHATAEKFGHSTVGDAVDLALRTHVGRLVLVHHAPGRTDDQVGQILAEAERHVASRRGDLPVQIGTELAVVEI